MMIKKNIFFKIVFVLVLVSAVGCASRKTLAERSQDYYNKAYSYYEQGNYQKAVTFCRRSISCQRDFSDTYFLLGRIYWKTEDYNRSIVYMRKAHKYDPDNLKIWISLGNVYKQKQEFEEAISCYQQVVKLDPSIAESYASIGECYYKMNQYFEAVQYFEKSNDMGFDNPDGLYMLAMSYLELNDREAALAECNTLREANPELADELLEFIKYKTFD
ncbi:MAG: tetratricopeptide repeat protein [Candidatus Omnitrophica bacterium]|nr:tetratricopeptide repeat protein [Candidatus Omnitrophota bacterium]